MIVFAEGTTTAYGTVSPFKRGMFVEACEASLPIQLVALEVDSPLDAWVDGASAGLHFFQRFSGLQRRMRIRFNQSLLYGSPNEGALRCQEGEAWVREQIQSFTERDHL